MSLEVYYGRTTSSLLIFLIIASGTGIKNPVKLFEHFRISSSIFTNILHEYFIYCIIYKEMWVQSEFPGSHHTPGDLPLPELII